MDRSVVGERYRVEARIGSGGMAEVFRGFDTVLNRTVAIKVLLPQFARDAGFVARFRREAQAAARLNHPNIVGVYDTGSDGDTQYIVMEFVEGRTLHDFERSGRQMGVMQAVELTEKLTGAVSAAHAQGVIHRDIKPANVMVTREGAVKVMDFGIARIETAETAPQTSAVLGTAAYLSPEQAQGMPVDARTDIYSLGTVLYELLCRRPPFTGDSPVAIAYKQVNETPELPSALNPDVPPQLDAVVMKALAKNPANRYQTAQAFRDDLERVRRGQDVDATPLLAASNGAEATQVIARPQSTQVLPPQTEEPGSGRKVGLGVLIGILIVALLAAGGFLLAQALGGDDVETVTLENYRGEDWPVVEADLERLGLVPVRRDLVRAEGQFASETVIRTDPRAGETVEVDTEVLVYVAVPPETVVVPDLVGMTPEAASDALDELGLALGETTDVTSDDVEPGQIASQSPADGTEVEPGTSVDVEVSTGPSTVTVPSVTCQKPDGAISELEAAGLQAEIVGEVSPLSNCPDPENIAMQDPEAGTSVDPGTVVQLWQGTVAPTDSPSPTP
ncbi:MAG TPA: Stk1 family PASTA domain-containing Ser/Thr kinase [Actinomycetota bacterium]|nr:Stk1 family PASTA domain-containing Ser/Thr kinase [Actinomycetota bacterium]